MPESERLAALCLVAVSGFLRPSEVETVCLPVCNACREGNDAYSIVVRTGNHLVLLGQQPSFAAEHNKSGIRGEKYDTNRYDHVEGHGSDNRHRSRHETADGNADEDSEHHTLCCAAEQPSWSHQRPPESRVMTHRRIRKLTINADVHNHREIRWPDGLRTLKFGWAMMDDPLSCSLPHTLLDIDLGGRFNSHIDAVMWPPGLLKVRFGDLFDRPIHLTSWPASVRSLTFGERFNQPVISVEWPSALEDLTFGGGFNQPIELVHWKSATANLKTLTFGMLFNQPVYDIAWPPHLRELAFGACFNEPIDVRRLPASLRLLQVSSLYDAAFQKDRDSGRIADEDDLPEGCQLLLRDVEWYNKFGP